MIPVEPICKVPGLSPTVPARPSQSLAVNKIIKKLTSRDTRRRAFRIRRGPYPECWEWECSLCQPPAHGARTRTDAWSRIIEISMPNHMRHRRCHHDYVTRRSGDG